MRWVQSPQRSQRWRRIERGLVEACAWRKTHVRFQTQQHDPTTSWVEVRTFWYCWLLYVNFQFDLLRKLWWPLTLKHDSYNPKPWPCGFPEKKGALWRGPGEHNHCGCRIFCSREIPCEKQRKQRLTQSFRRMTPQHHHLRLRLALEGKGHEA